MSSFWIMRWALKALGGVRPVERHGLCMQTLTICVSHSVAVQVGAVVAVGLGLVYQFQEKLVSVIPGPKSMCTCIGTDNQLDLSLCSCTCHGSQECRMSLHIFLTGLAWSMR